MPPQTRIVSPGPQAGTVITAEGSVQRVPAGWELLPPGDAALTRRVKEGGETWVMQEKRGRKVFSRGIWAPTERIAAIRAQLEVERSTESYAKRRAAGTARRERVQTQYVEDFHSAVVAFLRFAPRYEALASQVATAVTVHATPVGSGTVARTQRIPIERRAESAVIAWLRHQTTGYDNMQIARIKGERRAVRRQLAEQSRKLLDAYRAGRNATANCPLQVAVGKL